MWHQLRTEIYSPIEHSMTDAQHVLIASGAAAQQEVAAFLDHFVRQDGLSLESLDEWAQANSNSGHPRRSSQRPFSRSRHIE